MTPLEVDHIGFAVRDLDAAIATYEKLFHLTVDSRETLAEREIELVFLRLGNIKIELLRGLSSSDPITTFIEKRGEGMHHICYKVSNIHEELARFEALGATLLDKTPRRGAHGTLIAFLHPRDCHGVLTELCQYT